MLERVFWDRSNRRTPFLPVITITESSRNSIFSISPSEPCNVKPIPLVPFKTSP